VVTKVLESGPSLCLLKLKQLRDSKLNYISKSVELMKRSRKMTRKSVEIALGSNTQSGKVWFDERGWKITGMKSCAFYTYNSNDNSDREKKKI